jgi:hypothetical protein
MAQQWGTLHLSGLSCSEPTDELFRGRTDEVYALVSTSVVDSQGNVRLCCRLRWRVLAFREGMLPWPRMSATQSTT